MNELTSEDKIRESLLDQLKQQNKMTAYYVDMVERYIYHKNLAQTFQEDIDKRGTTVKMETGNGYKKEIDNPSIMHLQKETALLMQMWDKMGLNNPVMAESVDDYM